MKKTATIEDWKELFQKETGRSADSAEYHPAPSIRTPVYMDTADQIGQQKSDITHSHITHHLILHAQSVKSSFKMDRCCNHITFKTSIQSDSLKKKMRI